MGGKHLILGVNLAILGTLQAHYRRFVAILAAILSYTGYTGLQPAIIGAPGWTANNFPFSASRTRAHITMKSSQPYVCGIYLSSYNRLSAHYKKKKDK